MNNDLISREALKEALQYLKLINYDNSGFSKIYNNAIQTCIEEIDNAPTVEPEKAKESERPQGEFSRKDLESWLYQIAMNNIGTDFEKSVVEIIHRLDGFERFVSEQKVKKEYEAGL